MEGSNFKEGQIHEKLNEIIDESSPVKGLAHKIVRKCMKEGKLFYCIIIIINIKKLH